MFSRLSLFETKRAPSMFIEEDEQLYGARQSRAKKAHAGSRTVAEVTDPRRNYLLSGGENSFAKGQRPNGWPRASASGRSLQSSRSITTEEEGIRLKTAHTRLEGETGSGSSHRPSQYGTGRDYDPSNGAGVASATTQQRRELDNNEWEGASLMPPSMVQQHSEDGRLNRDARGSGSSGTAPVSDRGRIESGQQQSYLWSQNTSFRSLAMEEGEDEGQGNNTHLYGWNDSSHRPPSDRTMGNHDIDERISDNDTDTLPFPSESGDEERHDSPPQTSKREKRSSVEVLMAMAVHPYMHAALITASLFLSMIAAMSCRYLTVDIGFQPANIKMDVTDMTLGIWTFEGEDECMNYPQDFTNRYISEDGKWTLALVCSMVSLLAAFILFSLAWFVVLGLLTSSARLNSSLMTVVLFGVIFELIQFAFFGIAPCTEKIWLQPTTDSEGGNTLEKTFAEGCRLNRGARCNIATVVVKLFVLVGLHLQRKPPLKGEKGSGSNDGACTVDGEEDGNTASETREEMDEEDDEEGSGIVDEEDDDRMRMLREKSLRADEMLATLERNSFRNVVSEEGSNWGAGEIRKSAEDEVISMAEQSTVRRGTTGREEIETADSVNSWGSQPHPLTVDARVQEGRLPRPPPSAQDDDSGSNNSAAGLEAQAQTASQPRAQDQVASKANDRRVGASARSDSQSGYWDRGRDVPEYELDYLNDRSVAGSADDYSEMDFQ